jgi:hypothetical protein
MTAPEHISQRTKAEDRPNRIGAIRTFSEVSNTNRDTTDRQKSSKVSSANTPALGRYRPLRTWVPIWKAGQHCGE